MKQARKNVKEAKNNTAEETVVETKAERLLRLYRERQSGPTQFFGEAPPLHADTLWRGLTRGGEVRVLVVRATATVREAAARLECSPDVAQLLGELMVSTLLVRSTLNPEERMQVAFKHDGAVGQLLVDAWDEGGVRALARNPGVTLEADGLLLGAGLCEVTRSRHSGKRAYRSAVRLDGEGVDAAMMRYLLESEQILSLLRLHVKADANGVTQAQGFLVQLMPDGTRDNLVSMIQNLEALPPLGQGMTPGDPDARGWTNDLLKGFAWDQCAREPVMYQCRCSEDRILSMIATLPKAEIRDLAHGDELLETVCDYCRTRYLLRPSQVAALLDDPS